MRRRGLLTAVGAGVLSVVGCLSTSGDDEAAGDSGATGDGSTPTESDGRTGSPERRYEECSREVIPYDQFPADVQAEIDAALDGDYAADRILLREAMDVDESYVSVDGAYYDPAVTAESDREALELRRVDPKALPESRSVKAENRRDGERTVTMEVVADDRTVLLDEIDDLWPGGEVEFGRVRRVGTHELRVTVERDDEIETEVTEPIRVDESHFDTVVLIEPDGISLTGTVADLVECRFDG